MVAMTNWTEVSFSMVSSFLVRLASSSGDRISARSTTRPVSA
jgi:hypothetical protein